MKFPYDDAAELSAAEKSSTNEARIERHRVARRPAGLDEFSPIFARIRYDLRVQFIRAQTGSKTSLIQSDS